MNPYDRLESVRDRWLAGGAGEPTWYAVPADVHAWLLADWRVFDPGVSEPTFRGRPVIVAPGFGAGVSE